MKLDFMSRRFIKPSPSTAPYLQTFKLSLWEEPMLPIYGTLIFFYQSNACQNDEETLSMFFERSNSLQKSLSQALIHYYPLAGRLKDASTVECNDEGAYFVEARIDCQLSTFLNHPDAEFLRHFCPASDSNNLPAGCMLVIQLTLFNCGGIAITVSPSHKIADASSLCTFVQCWASVTTTREGSSKEVAPKPIFLRPSSSPPRALLNMPKLAAGEFVKRRFVFPASKIAQLRTKTTGSSSPAGQQHLSDANFVLALIMERAILASRSLSKSSSGPYLLFQVVNMRKRVRPSLAENTIGNLILYNITTIEEKQIELSELAGKFRKNLIEFCNLAANSSINEEPEFSIQGSPYFCTNICGFPLYEMDFGWGKASWVTSAMLLFRNTIVLQKTKEGDGIEVWISLDPREMVIFEQDHDILAYASNNPSVLAAYSRM